jgi:hypothetical protein
MLVRSSLPPRKADPAVRSRSLLRHATTLLLTGGLLASLSAGTAEAAGPSGCRVSPPDTHIVAGRKVDAQYLFTCDNRSIGYVKVTMVLRRDRPVVSDAVLESEQFDRFRDPSRAGVNADLLTDGACHPGHKYHGDITLNVTYVTNRMVTYHVRGRSVKCP